MSMHVNLSPEMEGFVKSKVETGFYGNATEVIRDALRRMQAEDSRIAAWKAAVKSATTNSTAARGSLTRRTP